MKRGLCVIVFALLPSIAAAGDIKTEVRKDAICVSPVSPQGLVKISAGPGTVTGLFPIQIVARNQKTDIAVGGSANPDGSFTLQIPANPKTSVKIIFIGANGKEKKVKVKVPKIVPSLSSPVMERSLERATITIPGGAPPHSTPEGPTGARGSTAPLDDKEVIEFERGIGEQPL
jgi:hypothetical protein